MYHKDLARSFRSDFKKRFKYKNTKRPTRSFRSDLKKRKYKKTTFKKLNTVKHRYRNFDLYVKIFSSRTAVPEAHI